MALRSLSSFPLALTLALTAPLGLGACVQNKQEPFGTQRVTLDEVAQTAENLQGVYTLRESPSPRSSMVPAPYILEVDPQNQLSIYRYSLRTLATEKIYLGRMVIVHPGAGDLIVDEAGFMAYLKPEIEATCGMSSDCQKDWEFRLRDRLRTTTPNWSLAGRQLSISELMRLSEGMFSAFSGFKVSAEVLARTKILIEREGLRVRGHAERSLAVVPKSDLKLARMILTNNGARRDHTIGSQQVYTSCDGSNVIVDEQIKTVRLAPDLSLTMNGSQVQNLLFTTTSTNDQLLTSFQIWNPYRCGVRSCSPIQVKITETSVALEEKIGDCVTLTSEYTLEGKLPAAAQP